MKMNATQNQILGQMDLNNLGARVLVGTLGLLALIAAIGIQMNKSPTQVESIGGIVYTQSQTNYLVNVKTDKFIAYTK